MSPSDEIIRTMTEVFPFLKGETFYDGIVDNAPDSVKEEYRSLVQWLDSQWSAKAGG